MSKSMSKFMVRAGTHLEPDQTDTTYLAEKRQRRERMYRAGEVFESNVNRVKQHGNQKFVRVGDEVPVTRKDVYISNPEEDLLMTPDASPVATMTIESLTEEQMGKMAFADLKNHCDKAGIDIKSAGTDRKKVIQLILEAERA